MLTRYQVLTVTRVSGDLLFAGEQVFELLKFGSPAQSLAIARCAVGEEFVRQLQARPATAIFEFKGDAHFFRLGERPSFHFENHTMRFGRSIAT